LPGPSYQQVKIAKNARNTTGIWSDWYLEMNMNIRLKEAKRLLWLKIEYWVISSAA
jgi:hypothetical protein